MHKSYTNPVGQWGNGIGSYNREIFHFRSNYSTQVLSYHNPKSMHDSTYVHITEIIKQNKERKKITKNDLAFPNLEFAIKWLILSKKVGIIGYIFF